MLVSYGPLYLKFRASLKASRLNMATLVNASDFKKDLWKQACKFFIRLTPYVFFLSRRPHSPLRTPQLLVRFQARRLEERGSNHGRDHLGGRDILPGNEAGASGATVKVVKWLARQFLDQ